ncbi:MAG: diguanylate cyclase [Elusimicrobia bacterium]|nr:diguanylate cyclase [Elusimicrobiota bacterium]
MTLSLKTRFLLAAILVTSFVLLYAVFTLKGQKATSILLREALSQNLSAMHLASEIKNAFVLYDDSVFRFLSTGDDTLLEESARARNRVKKNITDLKNVSESPVVKELLAELEIESSSYFEDVQKLMATAPRPTMPGEKDSIIKVITWAKQIPLQQKAVGLISAEGKAKLTRLYSLCDKLVDLNRVRLEDVQKQTHSTLDQTQKGVTWGGLFTFLGTTLIGLLLSLSVLTPLRELLAGIQRIMGGDLNFEITPRSADEIGRITQAFNAMTRNLKEKQEQLLRETITDALTGLYNFRYFQEELKAETERARRYNRPLSVLLMDIDHFKKYNDTHGHEMGNVVLKTASQALKETLRPTDVLARYGGEEFVAFLPDTDKAQAQRVAERVREAVDGSQFPGQETQPGGKITISVGGACFPADAKVAKDLIEKTDKALYQAKNKGRNRVEWI